MAAFRKVSGTTESLPQSLADDLRMISNEARKKYPAVREAAERCLMQIRKLANDNKTNFITGLRSSNHVIHSLLYCCDCKYPRIVELSLSAVQKMVVHRAIKKEYSRDIVGGMRALLVGGVEEVRVIQTLLLLVTTPGVVSGPVLGDIVQLLLTLSAQDDPRNPTLSHTSSAAVGQMVSSVFDNITSCSDQGAVAPPEVVDAFNLFQDICLLSNGDKANWMPRSPKMSRMLGLELIEATLKNHTAVFLQRQEFNGLVKERVCPLTIKLFSPSTKSKDLSLATHLQPDKPSFPLFVRLVRILVILVSEFFSNLVTECEIFLSLLVKFMEADKPSWQQLLSVEALNMLFFNEHIVEGLCRHYDMEDHANQVVRELVGALGGFVQGCFSHPPTSHAPSPAPLVGGEEGSPYVLRGSCIPVLLLPPSTSTKPLFMSMVDKQEPAGHSEGYPLAIAVEVLMNLVSSIGKLTLGDSTVTTPTKSPATPPATPPFDHKELHKQLLVSTWSGMLAALSLLLDACGEEMITENILKAHLHYIHLCGRYKMAAQRDAFLTSLCRAALPPNYTVTLVTGPPNAHSLFASIGDAPDRDQGTGGVTYVFEEERRRERHRLLPGKSEEGGGARYNQLQASPGEDVEVKTKPSKGPTPTSNANPEPAELTSKRLQCVRSLVNLAQCYAEHLAGGWTVLLRTLHHLAGLLGLQPQDNGSLVPVRRSETPANPLSSSPDKKSTLNMLCDLISNLFESSQHFSDATLTELISSLCKVSKSVGGASGQTGDVCMFSEAKLLEVSVSNLPRIQAVWDQVISHLMEGTRQPNQSVRQYCCKAVVVLTKLGLKQCGSSEVAMVKMFLVPLSQLTDSHYEEVRLSQLDSVMDLLQSCADCLTSGWHDVLMMVGSATDTVSEQLVRSGFQALQLITTDYLQSLPLPELPLCIVVAMKFAFQQQDINISLTSIGLLWSLADYTFQNSAHLEAHLPPRLPPLPVNIVSRIPGVPAPRLTTPFIGAVSNTSFSPTDRLWLMLFAGLGDVCVDDRGAVRKSGSQTLFSTVTAHGACLHSRAWTAVLWMVLYPLVDAVQEKTAAASTSNIPASYLMHHSRNTAQKQWVETQALTLSGVARLLQSRWRMLRGLEGFGRIWAKFCASLLLYGQSPYEEVVSTVLKCIRGMVVAKEDQPPVDPDPAPWLKLWGVWVNLARVFGLQEDGRSCRTSQAVLVEYFGVCLVLLARLHGRWREDQVREFGVIAMAALGVPVRRDTSPFLVPSLNSDSMSALQFAILQCHASLYGSAHSSQQLAGSEGLLDKSFHRPPPTGLLRETHPIAEDPVVVAIHPVIMETLLGCLKQVLALLSSPRQQEVGGGRRGGGGAGGAKSEEIEVKFGPFVLYGLKHGLHLCRSCHVTSIQSLSLFIKVLNPMLCDHPLSVDVWRQAHDCLLAIVEWAGRTDPGGGAAPTWQLLMDLLRDYLNAPPPAREGWGGDGLSPQVIEQMDIEIVEAVQNHIIPVVAKGGAGSVAKALSGILSQGSSKESDDPLKSNHCLGDQPKNSRENFSQVCFKALLQLTVEGMVEGESLSSQEALDHWVGHCEESLRRFSLESPHYHSTPPPAPLVREVVGALRSLSALIDSLYSRHSAGESAGSSPVTNLKEPHGKFL